MSVLPDFQKFKKIPNSATYDSIALDSQRGGKTDLVQEEDEIINGNRNADNESEVSLSASKVRTVRKIIGFIIVILSISALFYVMKIWGASLLVEKVQEREQSNIALINTQTDKYVSLDSHGSTIREISTNIKENHKTPQTTNKKINQNSKTDRKKEDEQQQKKKKEQQQQKKKKEQEQKKKKEQEQKKKEKKEQQKKKVQQQKKKIKPTENNEQFFKPKTDEGKKTIQIEQNQEKQIVEKQKTEIQVKQNAAQKQTNKNDIPKPEISKVLEVKLKTSQPYITENLVQGKCQKNQKMIEISDLRQITEKYIDIDKIKPFPELPICVIVTNGNKAQRRAILNSIDQQKDFSNFKSIYFSSEKKAESQFQGKDWHQVKNLSYYAFKEGINKYCQTNALVFIASDILNQKALYNLNQHHQSYSSWISYSFADSLFQVHSFYRRIFDLIETNDFENQKKQQLEKQNSKSVWLAFLELSQRHKRKIDPNELFVQGQKNSPIKFSSQLCVNSKRTPYQQLFTIFQEFSINQTKLQDSYQRFLENRQAHYNGYVAKTQNGITQTKGKKAIEYEQLYHLPHTHSLAKREYVENDNIYDISKYENEQLPFCIVVPSHNNVQNNRYKKTMLSILNLDYENYHIVFIDDNSDDGNLQKTKQYLIERGFPQNRVIYIQNLQRKFATYNQVHGGHSYCKEDDIQVILDGDDSVIGRMPLKILNAVYSNNTEIWVAYSNYISDKYTYGESAPIKHRLDTKTGKRARGHFMGLIRSWKVKLMRAIPLMYHQYRNGTWLTSMTDDALMYSFYELAGNDRIQYIPEILHLYSMDYGDNIYASKARSDKRSRTHTELIQYERNKLLDTLDTTFPPNEGVLNIFQEQKGKKFLEIYGKDP